MKKLFAIIFFAFTLASFIGWVIGIFYKVSGDPALNPLLILLFLPDFFMYSSFGNLVILGCALLWNISFMPYAQNPAIYSDAIGFLINSGLIFTSIWILCNTLRRD